MESTIHFDEILKNDVLAVRLIKNDIINFRLLNKLKGIGFVQLNNEHTLDLYQLIFEQLGVKNVDLNSELVDWYFRHIESICSKSPTKINEYIQSSALELLYVLKEQIADLS